VLLLFAGLSLIMPSLAVALRSLAFVSAGMVPPT
jgi:hypothetical protein